MTYCPQPNATSDIQRSRQPSENRENEVTNAGVSEDAGCQRWRRGKTATGIAPYGQQSRHCMGAAEVWIDGEVNRHRPRRIARLMLLILQAQPHRFFTSAPEI